MAGPSSSTFNISSLDVSAYRVPTAGPESDGTLEWDSTTMVLVSIKAGGKEGIGFTYADVSAAHFIISSLRDLVVGQHPMHIEKIFGEMHRQLRNNGNCGIAMMALSAIDIALWDLKSKIVDLPLVRLLGRHSEKISIYGSGGFISYTDRQLADQMSGWAGQGIRQMKMKIGTGDEKTHHRIRVAREAIGPENALFVDANGAYSVREALRMAEGFEKYHITWYEEPVSSDDLEGLAFLRSHTTGKLNIAAGEYGFNLPYFRVMLERHAVDVLQADATRCGGITGFLKAGRLAEAFQIPFSFHCAPSVHLHAALSLSGFFTGEYFYDHTRIEKLFFEGFREPGEGFLSPDPGRPGLGLELKKRVADKYRIFP